MNVSEKELHKTLLRMFGFRIHKSHNAYKEIFILLYRICVSYLFYNPGSSNVDVDHILLSPQRDHRIARESHTGSQIIYIGPIKLKDSDRRPNYSSFVSNDCYYLFTCPIIGPILPAWRQQYLYDLRPLSYILICLNLLFTVQRIYV